MESRATGYVAPLGQARGGRLAFLSGAAGITLLADPLVTDLARGSFMAPLPRIETGEGSLVIQYHLIPGLEEQVLQPGQLGEIRLNPSVSWEIEFHGPLTNLNADLRGLELHSLDVLGSARDVSLHLSHPAGTGFIFISGDTRRISIHRPSVTGVRLSVTGGISGLSFDGQGYAPAEGETNLVSADCKNARGWYEIRIAGRAKNLAIDIEG